MRYFETRSESDELERFLKPRMPFRARRIPSSDIRVIASALRTVEDVSEPISDIELDHKGVPILFRQYLKLGGRLLGFNVDPSFSDVVDGLVLVDLLKDGSQGSGALHVGGELERDSGNSMRRNKTWVPAVTLA